MAGAKRELDSAEAVRYDRQMRLWGVDAQLNMMRSNVVLVGAGCLGAEIAKNLVLGGVGALRIVDTGPVQLGDLGTNFLITDIAAVGSGISRAAACLPELKAMNGLVDLSAADTLEAVLPAASCVVVTDLPQAQALPIMRQCRERSIPCIACASFGMLCMSLSDFGPGFAVTTTEGSGEKQTAVVAFPDAAAALGGGAALKAAKKLTQSCVGCLALWAAGCSAGHTPAEAEARIAAAAKAASQQLGVEELPPAYVAELSEHCVGHFSPVCCVAGGIISQEVLKVVQCAGRPMVNMFVYDALHESKGYSERIEV